MKTITQKMQSQLQKMCATNQLFVSSVSGSELWDVYYNAFPKEYNHQWRDPESSVHNCNNCKNFMRHYGNIVALDDDYNLMTLWDIEVNDPEYTQSVKAVRDKLHSNGLGGKFIETLEVLNKAPYEAIKHNQTMYQLGLKCNHKKYTDEEVAKYGVVNSNDIYTFDHLNISMPSEFISTSRESKESIIGSFNSIRQVFDRALQEIDIDTLELVLELIDNNAILNGNTFKSKVLGFLHHKKKYLSLSDTIKPLYSFKNMDSNARFRNELIGALCLDIQKDGVEDACLAWNKRVDPTNYKRASAPITKQQIDSARKFVEEMGYEESFARRVATLDDISAHEILHINESKEANVSVFDKITPTSNNSINMAKNLENLPTMGIAEFMDSILPKAQSLQLFLTNEMSNNLVTLTTSKNKDSKRMFQWNNNFGWTYEGGLSGKSAIKQAVKNAGGFVDAPFRFSIMWNEDGRSIVDLDAHCEFDGGHVYYGNKQCKAIELDIDMIRPRSTGVENIFCRSLSQITDGCYKFYINNFDANNIYDTKAEIFIDGETFTYETTQNYRGNIRIADVYIRNGKPERINHYLEPISTHSKEIYGLSTNSLHDVELVCKSPNHWDNNNVGNLHYFFMLKGCKNPNSIVTFHTDQLNNELTEHRKVIQLLSNSTKVQCEDNQLSGVGFNSTMKEEFVVKATINNKSNLYKIKM